MAFDVLLGRMIGGGRVKRAPPAIEVWLQREHAGVKQDAEWVRRLSLLPLFCSARVGVRCRSFQAQMPR